MGDNVRNIDVESSKALHYSAATIARSGQTIQVSGQPGITKSGKVSACYESQIHLALLNLHKIIITAGCSVKDITKLTLYIVDYDPDRRLHTRHIQSFLQGHRTAITLVPVSQLAVKGWLFEIDAVLSKPSLQTKSIQSLPAPIDRPSQNRSTVDVVIVGAGLSGLTAARNVIRGGLSCIVLEARDRVGGKTWSQRLPGGDGTVDLGAAWLNDTNQTRAFALAKEFGAELIEQNTTGNAVLQDFDHTCQPFAYGELPPFPAETRDHLANIRDTVERDCQKIDPNNPCDEGLDSMTFETYLRGLGASKIALTTGAIWTRAMLGQEPSDISALYFLTYCKAGGGLLQMRSDRTGGGQHLRIRRGTQTLASGLATSLPSGTIRLSTPVLSIFQEGHNSVHVTTPTGMVDCKKVIISVPSPVYNTIDMQPPLPPAKTLLASSTRYGYYTKVMMVFAKPFWIERGFCGLVQSFTGPASIIRDTSAPVDDKWILTCFLAGDTGRAWSRLSEQERMNALKEQVGSVFGVGKMAEETFVTAMGHEWSTEQYSGWGCPCTSLPPGVLDAVGNALCESFGSVHFVGTETSGQWKGYMEGAILSGERGAAEVLNDLRTVNPRL